MKTEAITTPADPQCGPLFFVALNNLRVGVGVFAKSGGCACVPVRELKVIAFRIGQTGHVILGRFTAN